jgi:hypothetical protein
MKVTRDVVTDLMPLYLAGDASADTTRLVEDFLAADGEFAAMVKQSAMLRLEPLPGPPAGGEMRALLRTRRLVKRRSWYLGLAVACMLTPLTFFFNEHGLVWVMWRDSFPMAVFFWIWAAGFGLLYYRGGRPLR